MKKYLLAILICIAFNNHLWGSVIYNESINGPASNDYHNPTQLGTLSLGLSTINGSVLQNYLGNGNYRTFTDFYTFSVPIGEAVSRLSITDNGQSQWVWLGNSTFSSQLGFTTNVHTGNLLQQWSLNSISPGTYGIYIQNTSDAGMNTTVPYSFTFTTSTVPEPLNFNLCLFSIGCGLISIILRKRISPHNVE